jgi:nucleotidyltransferase AbiEii toxin of type IV toxin-antitoxin system
MFCCGSSGLEGDVGTHAIANELRKRDRGFALVGGLAISIRGEVRATQDVDIAVAVADDADLEGLVHDLAQAGYVAVTTVDQEAVGRPATVRLESPAGVVVDLVAAACGIEPEIVASALPVPFEGIADVPVARAEDLLAMKVLWARAGRPHDSADAQSLLLVNPALDLASVRERLRLMTERGFARNQDLFAKLDALLKEA